MMQLPPYSDSFHVARLSLTRSLTHSVEPRTGALFDHCCAEYYFTIAFIMGYVYYISLFLFVNYLRSFCTNFYGRVFSVVWVWAQRQEL